MVETNSDGMFYTVPSRGVLALKTNIKKFRWPFGQNVPLVSSCDHDACAVRMCLLVQPDNAFVEIIRRSGDDVWGKYHFLSGKRGGRLVFYRRPFLLGSEIYLEASDLLGQEPLVRVNRKYYRFVHFRFMNLHSVNYLLTDLAALLLLCKQFAPIYCSAFKKDGRTVVVFAPSNTGKTLTSMTVCLEYGADFISEDLAITDGQQVFALPWTSTFRYSSKEDMRWLVRLKQRATRFLPFLALLSMSRDRSITDYLPEERICHRSIATHLVILERGARHLASEPRESAFRKIVNLNRVEFNYRRSLVNNAYEYFNPELDVAAAYETERLLLRRLVDSVQECCVIRAADPADYAGLVLQAVG